MRADAVIPRKGGYATGFGGGYYHAVEGVLEAYDARGADVYVGTEERAGLYVFEGEVLAVGCRDGLDLCACQGGDPIITFSAKVFEDDCLPG